MPTKRARLGSATALGAAALLLAVALSACTTKSKAQAQARSAYQAGQTQAVAQRQPQPITVWGNVARPTIEWREGLTLAQALIEAQWLGRNDPASIVVRRQGLSHFINTRQFLGGHTEDPVLEPGDIVELRR